MLFGQLNTWENLVSAGHKAALGKRDKASAVFFLFRQETELLRLQHELSEKTWRPGGYRSFRIFDPKERLISAAPFHDRVVHHALCNVIEPVFEKSFIYDSYANRKGKGTHQAILRFHEYARRHPFVLKCDIRKFFPSLDHAILKQEIRRRIWCPDTLWLIDAIIDGSNPQEPVLDYFPGDEIAPLSFGGGGGATRRRGLPIGNLTSQFWANVYLNRFDHYVKETLRVPGYIRYVDDFVLFADSKEQLHQWRSDIQNYLDGLRLLLHPDKTHIYRCADGVPFLGFRVFPYHRYVRKEKTRRYRRFLKQKIKHYRAGHITPDELEQALNAWLGHIRFGQSRRLEYNIYRYLRDAGINVLKHPDGAWKVLEYRQIRRGIRPP
ncbi:MAG: RNA-directed DNA polymerase [Saprospiraceae bacterium]|nr:RNA-directed DNA polymerase [Saprospiraceae bacterium]